MKKIKFISKLLTILVLISIIFTSFSSAATKVTEEQLNKALQNITGTEATFTNPSKTITLTMDDVLINLQYDLSGDKPVFTVKVPVANGMEYADITKKEQALPNALFISYAAIANIFGIEYLDSVAYVTVARAVDHSITAESNIKIFDDVKDPTIEKTEDSNHFYVSTFKDNVINYLKLQYSEKKTIKDSIIANSFVQTIELTDVTDTAATLSTVITVDPEADFSKIKGYKEKFETGMGGNFSFSIMTNSSSSGGSSQTNTAQNTQTQNKVENKVENTQQPQNTTNTANTANTTNTTNTANTIQKIPNAGYIGTDVAKYFYVVIVFSLIFIGILYFKSNKK